MKTFYTDHFVLPLPAGPAGAAGRNRQGNPACASGDYLQRVQHGSLSAGEIRRIGFPCEERGSLLYNKSNLE
ncbi:MAG TPA: hypothetical protein VHE58_02280 [Burkholderiales bacterium]|nr:hypothetical protein [Burkholderiales bacterium]